MKTYIIVEFKCFSDPPTSGICRNDDVKNFHCQRNFFFFERRKEFQDFFNLFATKMLSNQPYFP